MSTNKDDHNPDRHRIIDMSSKIISTKGYVLSVSIEQQKEITSLKKRISIQKLYISLLDITTERGKLIYDSAVSQLQYFQRLLHDKGIPND